MNKSKTITITNETNIVDIVLCKKYMSDLVIDKKAIEVISYLLEHNGIEMDIDSIKSKFNISYYKYRKLKHTLIKYGIAEIKNETIENQNTYKSIEHFIIKCPDMWNIKLHQSIINKKYSSIFYGENK